MALAEWARRRGQSLSVTAVDVNPKVLSLAQRLTGECPEVRLVQSSGADLAFRDDSFDFAISSLTFHHFDEDLAARVLGEMHRIARRGVIVNDLQRGYLPAGLIWLVTRVTRMHPLTQHDAPLSVMRALTVSEYRELAVRAGVPGAQVYKHPFWRAALVARKGE
jgi:ubiquinone/menaquinone biosynthesis C-methylase UbiE